MLPDPTLATPVPPSSDPDLLARLHQAEEAVRARDDFLAMAAHELRSPLHALALRLAALERLATQSQAPVLAAELQRARRSVDRYVRRAVTLLDVSRLHAGVLVPALAPVRVAEVVREVVDDYREEAAFHGASLQAEVDEALEGLWDRHMLEQIFANLVSNAIKYGNGTPVGIRARAGDDGQACLEVFDRGPGIAPADRQRIFDKFERVVATSGERAGFGLGLWIVGRMVAAHHGRVDVAQQPDGGALFRVVLPLQPTRIRQEEEDKTA